MKSRLACVVLAVVCAGALMGCATSQSYQSYRDEVDGWSYGKRFVVTWKDWGLDLLDIFSLELSAGEQIGATVMPTELMQMGVYFGNVMKVGYRDRAFGYYVENRKEGGASWFYYRYCAMDPLAGTPSLLNEEYRPRLYDGFPIRDNKEWHWMDLGAEVGVIFFGASVHVSPKETLDFAVSTLTLPFDLTLFPLMRACGLAIPEADFCEDDTAARVRKKHNVELITHPDGLPPIEYLNERVKQGY